uniref:Uncharacterized protein n=1 Tax=viral metagenome TaxID=1070528 RepID=A0A6C0CYT1_9ZZZZ
MNNYINLLLFFLTIAIVLRITGIADTGNKNIIMNRIPRSLNNIRNDNKIINNFNNLSDNRLVLSGKKIEKYFNKNTIDEDMKNVIINILNVIIKNTSNIENYKHYVIKDIYDIHQQVDMNRNQRFVVNFFIYSVNTYTTKKILVDFIIINSQLYINYIGEDVASIYKLLDKYDLKVSEAIQNMKKPYSFGYLKDKNNVELLDLYYRVKELNVIDYNQSINDYPDYVSKLSGIRKVDISELVNKYLPTDSPSITSPQFCDNIDSNKWDSYGINNQLNNCTANNNTVGYIPNIPDNYPGSTINPRSYYGKFSDQLQNIGFNTNGYNIKTTSY